MLLSAHLNVRILRALADGPLRLADLRKAIGGPAQSTLRGNLAKLTEIDALHKRIRDNGSSVQGYELTPCGEELLRAADAVDAWLGLAPGGPLTLRDTGAKSAIKALVGGWTSAIVRALASRPLTLTELDKLIDNCTYPALERRLSAMRLAGQIELRERSDGSGRHYTVEPWLRQAIGPLTVAARCERRHMRETTGPIARIDVESAFLLVAPMLELCAGTSGVCQLAVEPGGRHAGRPWAGAQVTLDDGAVTSCVARLEPRPENWAMGTASAWMDAVICRETEVLEFGGDGELGRDIVHGLHDALFGQFALTQSD
ncbi:MAG: winged helix-turn-helix transcriptional regulator [Chloroflexota bacterium]